ncbi:MAG: hypothetical protein JW716_00290 [Candidatus Aenigmarchaeota archaeon]|nr:hypothetical protein [Candidatus Aenigmarchaeota archaeon]
MSRIDRARIIMDEIEPAIFTYSIFQAGANLFAPVAIYAAKGFQTLENSCDEQNTHPSLWMSHAGPAGIGQYSLRRKEPAGVLAKIDAHFRYPTTEEMNRDFEHYGDQVLGPQVSEVKNDEKKNWKNNPQFKFWGEYHYFTGPLRLIKTVTLSSVFPGDIPKNMEPFFKEISEASHQDEPIIGSYPGYQFLHANGGVLRCLPFSKREDFDPDKMKPYGKVEMSDGQMMYTPPPRPEKVVEPIDFSSMIVEEI